MKILNRQVKRLRNKDVASVKVLWRNHSTKEFTWEAEDAMKVSRSIGDAYLKKSELNQGIARRLIKAALHVAAKKREMRYSDLEKIDRGVRRHFHDDITVVVVFIDPHSMNRSSSRSSILSIRGGTPSSPKL
ncbi:hypothetical protein RND71_035881 [Anisodus tanguticus]|uniref:Uncharacterized protein n=1 Tax=Anisodus tanguticus TaxID=243964 RepID=A0AAE1R5V7_9SOLA|nr:hypothetical protein RND71_035881 [Anisodus tanguticus]